MFCYLRLFIGFQWTLIMVQFIVAEVVPDVPPEVEIQGQRQEFIRSKILDKVADEDAEVEELERTMSTNSNAQSDQPAKKYNCFGCEILPCCRSHKGKYLDRKRNMTGCSDVVVKQYPVLATTGHRNPMMKSL